MSNNEIEACQKKYKELEAGKSGIYNTIGRLYFEKYKDSPEGEFADSVNRINKINEEMKQIDLRIKFINGIVVCTNCGLENGVKSSFCSGCGTRLPHTYSTDGMRCSNCGGLINPGQKFCGSCGAAIPQRQLRQQNQYHRLRHVLTVDVNLKMMQYSVQNVVLKSTRIRRYT